jgi:multiple sugar transport system substrate-binding protein
MNKSAIFNGVNLNFKFLTIFSLTGFLIFSSGLSCTRQDRLPAYTLVVWNLFDDSDAWKEMIESYVASVKADQTKQPVKIEYYKKNFSGYRQYEEELNNAIAAGKGPDIFTIHNDWLPRYQSKISPMDDGAKGAQSFSRRFVDAASDDFLVGAKIYAIPLSVDTMALYYNEDLLKNAGIFDPPRTWDEFKDDVVRLTVFDKDKTTVIRAGAAIGADDKNVNRASDILSLLMMQSGSPMVDEEHKRTIFNEKLRDKNENSYSIGGMAFQFYTDFANPAKTIYTWNPAMDYSIDAFYQARAAMMLNYSYNIPVVKAKAPKLKFSIAPMPQIAGATRPVNYANYWAMTVSIGSSRPKESWDFLSYISNPEISKKYLAKAGKPTAQKDLAEWQANGEDLNMAVFAKQSLTAKSWYQVDPITNESILNDAIKSVVLGRVTPEEASDLASSQITQTMRK